MHRSRPVEPIETAETTSSELIVYKLSLQKSQEPCQNGVTAVIPEDIEGTTWCKRVSELMESFGIS